MDLPIAVPVSDGMEYKVPEVYTLEQKQKTLSLAEQELDALLRSSEDYFESREEMDATLYVVRQQPDNVYTKPFMKKIASAILRVNACRQDVEWALESVADTSLTPAQVKAQVKQMLETQRVSLERQLDQRMIEERLEWAVQLRQLREELEEERRHRKAFQAKVKDFSEEVWFNMCTMDGLIQGGNMKYRQDDVFVPRGQLHMRECIRKMIFNKPARMFDVAGSRDNFLYKRAGITEADWPVDVADYDKDNKGELLRQRQRKAVENITLTTFGGES